MRTTSSVDPGCEFDGWEVEFPGLVAGWTTVFEFSLLGAGDLLGMSSVSLILTWKMIQVLVVLQAWNL